MAFALAIFSPSSISLSCFTLLRSAGNSFPSSSETCSSTAEGFAPLDERLYGANHWTLASGKLSESTVTDVSGRVVYTSRDPVEDRTREPRMVRPIRTFENDARISAARVESLNASLDGLKRAAGQTGEQDVQLRALEREAKAQRDLLESYLAKYREASTRETMDATPSDGRPMDPSS